MPIIDLPPPPPLAAAYAEVPTGRLALRQDEGAEPPPRTEEGNARSQWDAGDMEFKVRVGATGNEPDPRSLIESFISWTEFQFAADFGVANIGDFSFGIGGELFYARPWIIEAISNATLGAGGNGLRWHLWQWGLAARGTVHYRAQGMIDPYAVLLLGPSVERFVVKIGDGAGSAEGSFTSAGLRAGLGGGASFVTKNGLSAGVELRYIFGLLFKNVASVSIEDDNGDEVDVFTIGDDQAPPFGFSWMFFIGWRFN